MTLPVFSSIVYFDPFEPLPSWAGNAGVTAFLSSATPAQTVAYAQLLADQTPIAWGTGASAATSVAVLNPVPLVAGAAYTIQVQYAAPQQNPQNLDWSNSGVASAPVVSAQPALAAATTTAAALTVASLTPPGAVLPGVNVQLVDLTTGALTRYAYAGTARVAAIAAQFTAQHDYGLVISGVQPLTPTSRGGFTGPYSWGAPTVVQPIPTSAPSITAASYDGATVAATWTAPTIPVGAASPRFDLILLDGGAIVATATAGATGGQLATGAVGALTAPTVAARLSYGPFVGPTGAGLALQTLAPTITGVAVTAGTTITAQLSAPTALATGAALVATLYTNGVAGAQQTLGSATGAVTWSGITPVATNVYAIDAAVVTTAGAQRSAGPRSPRVTVPLAAAQSVTASYDGRTVTIGLAFASRDAVSGYAVTLAAPGATTITATAGPALPIVVAANLDLTKAWTATVTPVIGIVTAPSSAAATVALPAVAAPTLTTAGYDGTVLTLQWSAATLPFLSGYRVSVSGGPTVVTTADQTACAIPLSPSKAAGAVVTVTGLSPLRETAASAGVAVVSAAIPIASVAVGANVVAGWAAATAPAVQAALMIGDAAAQDLNGATATGISFAPPSATAQPYRLRVRGASADGVATGPATSADLILAAPRFTAGQIADGRMTLAWSPPDGPGVASYLVTATPATGSAASVVATGAGYDGIAPAAFLSPGTMTITPRNARCTGPAASVTLHAGASFTTGSYDGRQLSVSADLGVVGGTDAFWLDVLVDGVLAARKTLVQSAAAPIANPLVIAVALPAGSSAVVRLADVGPASLGPAATAAIPTLAPTPTQAVYDGAKLHVGWQPTVAPGVDGYVVSVDGATPAVADTYVAGAATAAAAITAALTYPYTGVAVTVRAAAATTLPGVIRGPAGVAIAPVQAASLYSTAVGAAGNPPYLYRRGVYQAAADVRNQPIVLYLPKPFTATTDPTVPATGTPTFQLAPAPAGSALPYRLTIAAAAWSSLGAGAVRPALQQEYVQFLTSVEAAGVQPWAIGLVRQMIAQAMPQTFEELLYYRYGLWRSDALRTVDLTPGTRLRLANSLYQAVVGGTNAKNGFLALGNETIEIADAIPQGGAGSLPTGPARSLSVDTFLSLVYPGGGSADTGRPVAAGPVDFFAEQNRQTYYRLFYPPAFPSSGSNGSTALTDNVTLVGTTSWSAMATVTGQYATTGTFPANVDYFATYFRGRASLTPLVSVAVQGEPQWVTLGTTVRQLLATQGLAPIYGGKGGDALTMTRATANLFAQPVLDAGLSLDQVDLGNGDLGGVVPLYWPLDMPVVGGDQIGLRRR